MQEEDPPAVKKQYIINNLTKIPEIYQKDAQNISSLNAFAQTVKIQTFYKTLKPLIFSYRFEEPHSEVEYPLATIVAFPHSEQNYQSVNLRFTTWVQSGGLRCIPLKNTANQKEIQKSCSLTHCIIIPDWGLVQPQNFNQFISDIITEFHTNHSLPMFFVGKSAVKALSMLIQLEIGIKSTNQGNCSQVYISHQSHLFRDLTLPLRLGLQNRKKIMPPPIKINPRIFQQKSEYFVSGIMMSKNGEQLCCIIQNNEQKLYFLLNQPHTCDNPESISLWHKLIVNFVDTVRSKKRTVNEKQVEKLLLANNKLVMKGEQTKGHYKIG